MSNMKFITYSGFQLRAGQIDCDYEDENKDEDETEGFSVHRTRSEP
jgi:hypothetical protein